jgi:hypothetical protein
MFEIFAMLRVFPVTGCTVFAFRSVVVFLDFFVVVVVFRLFPIGIGWVSELFFVIRISP